MPHSPLHVHQVHVAQIHTPIFLLVEQNNNLLQRYYMCFTFSLLYGIGLNTEKGLSAGEHGLQGEEVVQTLQGYDRIAAYGSIYLFFVPLFVFAVFET